MSHIQKVRIGSKKIDIIVKNTFAFLNKKNDSFFHIANINPEIFILATKDNNYRKIINDSDEVLIDGIGIWLLAKITGVKVGEKLAGTDLMIKLIELASQNKKGVLFLGGFKDTAKQTAYYFQKKYPTLMINYSSGAYDIKKETKKESRKVLTLITTIKPSFLFVAYGPPWQEKWIYKHRAQLRGIVCMGVGGSFNFFCKKIIRAPRWVIRGNLEWVWRFIFEPSRLKRKSQCYYEFFLLLVTKIVHLFN